MEKATPTSNELEAYNKVKKYLDSKTVIHDHNRLSIIPKLKWLWVMLAAIVSVLCYYALTTILFGEQSWIESIVGSQGQ